MGHLQEKKEKKKFLHIFHSLMLHSNILPMNPSAEKHCVMKNLNKNDFVLQSRFGQKKQKTLIPLVCVCPGLSIRAVAAVGSYRSLDMVSNSLFS